MMNNKNDECELLLFHSTTKKNLKAIMREGIKPGMKDGWCELRLKKLETKLKEGNKTKYTLDEIEYIKKFKKDCKDNIYLTTSFHLNEQMSEVGIDTIITVCLPKNKVYIKGKQFKDVNFNSTYDPMDERYPYDNLGEVTVKGDIEAKYIVGCLDIKEKGYGVGNTKFKINKLCK